MHARNGLAVQPDGMILFRDGMPFIFEAVAMMKFTPLDQQDARGKGQHVW